MVGNGLSQLEPFVSPIVIEEVSRGDRNAAKLRLEKIESFPILEITEDVRELAEMYFKNIPIPDKAKGDAFHLATATYHGMEFLVTWNFTHILNAHVRSAIRKVNTLREFGTPIICSPEELLEV